MVFKPSFIIFTETKQIMSTIFPWMVVIAVIAGLAVIALIVDYITKER